jgi:type I restriction enzyme, S subunit
VELSRGYKQSDVGIIPEDWEVRQLAELFTLQNGVNAEKGAYGRGIPFINVLEVITHLTIDESRIPGRILLPPQAVGVFAVKSGDVLFNRTSETQDEVGLASLYTGFETVVFGGFVIRARPRDDRTNASFRPFALRSAAVRSQIIARGQGAVRANIGQRDLCRVKVPLPSVAEQRAIAETLSDADALIESLEQLLAKKRQIEQGAMQALLTGKNRLPGFEVEAGSKQSELGVIPQDWDVHCLGEGIKLTSGQHVLAQHCTTDDVGIAYITGPSDFTNRRIQHSKYTTKPGIVCEANDILVTVKGSGVGSLARADMSYCISRQLMAIRVVNWSPDFVFFSLKRNASLFGAAASGLIPGLSREDVLGSRIALPRARAEQSAIAAALTDMDSEIFAIEAKVAKARLIKQGMMQQLLTGAIRLPLDETRSAE